MSIITDADGVSFARNTRIANVDVVVAGGEVGASPAAQCNVAAAGSIEDERTITGGRVRVARSVARERLNTDCRVVVTGAIANYRGIACSRIKVSGCIAI